MVVAVAVALIAVLHGSVVCGHHFVLRRSLPLARDPALALTHALTHAGTLPSTRAGTLPSAGSTLRDAFVCWMVTLQSLDNCHSPFKIRDRARG